jgi:hypothetical protein
MIFLVKLLRCALGPLLMIGIHEQALLLLIKTLLAIATGWVLLAL